MRRVEDTCFKNSLVILRFSFFASAQAEIDFLVGPPVWTAIVSVNFTNFLERAATAMTQVKKFSLATSYKM